MKIKILSIPQLCKFIDNLSVWFPDLSHIEARCLIYLFTKENRKTKVAPWPSQTTTARAIGINVRNLRSRVIPALKYKVGLRFCKKPIDQYRNIIYWDLSHFSDIIKVFCSGQATEPYRMDEPPKKLPKVKLPDPKNVLRAQFAVPKIMR